MTKHFPPVVPDPQVDLVKFVMFLQKRRGPDGTPITSLFCAPETKEGGWFRLQFRKFSEQDLPRVSPGARACENDGQCDWHRAWYGCKLEALYSILYHGRLYESRDSSRGERFIEGVPGVYVHSDKTASKAMNYARFVPLFQDGVFWSVKLEVRVDRCDRIPISALGKTDQWVQKDRSVVLAALWVCGRTHATMEEGAEVQLKWDPMLESNPSGPLELRAPPVLPGPSMREVASSREVLIDCTAALRRQRERLQNMGQAEIDT